MKYLNKNWKEFTISEFFDVERGSLQKLEYSKITTGTRVISAITKNNGFAYYSNSNPTYNGNMITIGNTGQASVGVAFYQEEPFIATINLNILIPKFSLNKYIAIFLISVLKKEKYRLSFGRILNEERCKNHKIKLPIDNKSNPDWKFMEDYIKNLDRDKRLEIKRSLIEKRLINKKKSLNERKWDFFELQKDLFTIKKGKRIVVSKNKMIGTCPFISSTNKNNGISHYLDIKPNHKKNTITISYDGSIGEVFYQNQDFWAVDSVNVLYPKFSLNKYIAMFLIPILKKEKFRFNYGRKWDLEKMSKTKIKLPIDNKSNPDWKFMEDYIKSLPYSSNL